LSFSGCVSVTYYPVHKGHSCDLAHIRLCREQREAIAVKLAAGIPFDDILDSTHSSTSVSALTSLQFVTKKDLVNISHAFGINRGAVLHINDADSVAAWVNRTRQEASSRNLVRLIIYQGETSVLNLKPEDFMLVLASDAQVIGARQFCGPNREICLDSTHGMNCYDFQLTTVMCIDEHGEGYPVAFCYSNRVDIGAMTLFLQVVKEAIGYPLCNVVLMTDDTEVYSSAWNSVMGEPAHRLLCAWHIDRAWRKNLSRIKGDSELKAIVYKTMRSLLEMTDPELFIQKMRQFLEAGKEDE
jgi:MULE transposase domain